MLSIVYVSAATRLVDKAELTNILRQARENNQKLGITGLLLHVDGNFMQAAEGPDDAIETLQKKLALDPRHKNIITLIKQPITERQFPQWSMGFRDQTAVLAEDRKTVSGFLTDAPDHSSTQRSAALRLLEGFRNSMT